MKETTNIWDVPLSLPLVLFVDRAQLDVFIGDQGLVTAPHWSRPPMSRLSLEPHELGTPIGFPWYAG